MNRSVLLPLILLLIGCLVLPVAAEGPEVLFADGTEDVPPILIEQLLADYPNAGAIHILRWNPGHAETAGIGVTVQAEDVTVKDMFVRTHAKGSYEILPENIEMSATTTFRGETSGECYFAANLEGLGFGTHISVVFPEGSCYGGPDENSPWNSREYRVRWIGRTGTFPLIQVMNSRPEGKEIICTWAQPIDTLEYAVDRFISPEGGI